MNDATPPKKKCWIVSFSFVFLVYHDLKIGDLICLYLMWRSRERKHEQLKNVNVWNIQNRSGALGIHVPNISSKNGVAEFNSWTISFSTKYGVQKQTHKYGVADCWWFIVFLGVFGMRNQLPLFLVFRDLPLGVVNPFVLKVPWWIPTG